MEKVFYIDDTDVTIDNRDIDGTNLRYKELPGIVFSVSVRFAFEIVINAIENAGKIDDKTNEALQIVEAAISSYDDDAGELNT